MSCPSGPGTALGLLGNQGDIVSPGQAPLLTCPDHAHFRRWLQSQAGSWAGGWVPSCHRPGAQEATTTAWKVSLLWVPWQRPGGCEGPNEQEGSRILVAKNPRLFPPEVERQHPLVLSGQVGIPLDTHKRKPHSRCPAPSHPDLKGKARVWFRN